MQLLEKVCPVCGAIATKAFCQDCGWSMSVTAESAYYEELLNEKVRLWVQVFPEESQDEKQVDNLGKELERIKREIESLKEELNEVEQAFEDSKNHLQSEGADMAKKEELIYELEGLDMELKEVDCFIKPFDNSISHEKLTCSFRNEKVFLEGRNIRKLPSLLLVLSRRRLYGTTKAAEFFIRLDEHVKSAGKGKWVCVIPNHMGLKGKYYAMVSNMHEIENSGVKINCRNDVVNFTENGK